MNLTPGGLLGLAQSSERSVSSRAQTRRIWGSPAPRSCALTKIVSAFVLEGIPPPFALSCPSQIPRRAGAPDPAPAPWSPTLLRLGCPGPRGPLARAAPGSSRAPAASAPPGSAARESSRWETLRERFAGRAGGSGGGELRALRAPPVHTHAHPKTPESCRPSPRAAAGIPGAAGRFPGELRDGPRGGGGRARCVSPQTSPPLPRPGDPRVPGALLCTGFLFRRGQSSDCLLNQFNFVRLCYLLVVAAAVAFPWAWRVLPHPARLSRLSRLLHS